MNLKNNSYLIEHDEENVEKGERKMESEEDIENPGEIGVGDWKNFQEIKEAYKKKGLGNFLKDIMVLRYT